MLTLYIIAAALSLAFPALLAWGQYGGGRKKESLDAPDEKKGISVIIAARNEEKNLPGLVQALLSQDYEGEWECVVVLGRCTDGSGTLMKRLAGADSRLRVLEIAELPEGWTGKKWALEQGIAAAQHERIALTDADCRPESGWLSGISAGMDRGNELVLGLGLYHVKKGLLNDLVRFETHLTAMQYLGMAGLGMPYMGVGRNMGYTKAFFRRAGGMAPIAGRLSGDDDLLVNRHADPGNTTGMTAKGTRTLSEPPSDWRAWWRQKIRHLSAGTGYRPATVFILGSLSALQAIFYLSLVGVLCSDRPQELVWGIYAGRTVLAAIFWNSGKGFRMSIELVLLFPLLDVCYLLYHLIMAPASLIFKPKWK